MEGSPGNFLSSARLISATEYGRRASIASADAKGLAGLLLGKPVHLAGLLHLFARRVARGANALDAELELVGVGRTNQSFVQCDQSLSVQIVERLVESLHAVLRDAAGDGVMNHAGLIRIDHAIADEFRGNQNLDGGHAADAV